MIAVVLATLAAGCAFVIAYGSYHNQFMDTRTPRRLALRTAVTTFLFFLTAALLLPWLFSQMATR
jgi:hypothetical protein